MLLLNIEYIPGKKIEALGIAKGSVVQSKNFGKDFMAGMKTLVGGEIAGYTEMLTEARQIATKRMVDDAEAMYRRALAFAATRELTEFRAEISDLRVSSGSWRRRSGWISRTSSDGLHRLSARSLFSSVIKVSISLNWR